MMIEVLEHLAVANVAAGAAVVVVLALRRPVRRWFGPRIAYGLWMLPPLAALATLLPARTITLEVDAEPAAVTGLTATGILSAAGAAPASIDLAALASGLWLAGAFASLAWLAWKQAEFARAARAGFAGPAVLGVLRPRIVTPGDFTHRYTVREQAVVLAHEAAHIARHDSRVNALMALARCVNWFNPLAHVAAHYLRLDQELACDACVVATHPQARRSYAQAMLKTQLASRPLPLGCYWPAPGVHPLAERVSLLGRPAPGRARRRLGAAAMALLASAAVSGAWAAKPAHVRLVERAGPRLPTPVSDASVAARPDADGRPAATMPAPPEASLATSIAEPAALSAPAAAALQAAADAGVEPIAVTTREADPSPRPQRIYTASRRSRVQPGSAVRLVAMMIDPDGRPLMNDVTAFGSQHYYRTGTFVRDGSRFALFTSVVQDGDTLWVTASTNAQFRGPGVGTVAMTSGETRDILLGDGQVVTVTPTLRPETPEEAAGSRPALRRLDAAISRDSVETWRSLRDRCGVCRAAALPKAAGWDL